MCTRPPAHPAALALLAAAATSAGNARFYAIGDLEGGPFHSRALAVSPNGLWVAGSSRVEPNGFNAPVTRAVRWSVDTGLIDIGNLNPDGFFSSAAAVAISNDGQAATGLTSTTGSNQAFLWTTRLGMVGLGGLSGPDGFSNGYDITPDGQRITGTSIAAGSTIGAFTWTHQTAMVGIPMWTAVASSNDGTVIAGHHAVPFRAVRWTMGEPQAQELGSLPGGAESFATAMSAGGDVVVGYADTLPSFTGAGELGGLVQQAFVWRQETGMVALPTPPGSVGDAALGVTADGDTIVGYATLPDGDTAFIWRTAHPPEPLRDYLERAYALDLTGWTLRRATAISDDAGVIVGYAVNPQGDIEGFVVHLPLCQGDLDNDGLVASNDLNILLHAFGSTAAADLDADGDTDSDDLNALLRAFGCQAEAPN